MLSLYCCLLRLYPIAYRDEFGDEMTCVFLESYETARGRFATCARFYGRELSGVLTGALREHVRMATGYDPIPFRRLRMQPPYRFPKSTAIFMCLSLLAVMIAITKAEIIIKEHAHAPVGMPGWVSAFSLSFAFICFVVMIGLSLLYVSHRSGVQRFERLQSWPTEN